MASLIHVFAFSAFLFAPAVGFTSASNIKRFASALLKNLAALLWRPAVGFVSASSIKHFISPSRSPQNTASRGMVIGVLVFSALVWTPVAGFPAVASVRRFSSPAHLMQASLEHFSERASCPYEVRNDTVEGRNPRTITRVTCTSDQCECSTHLFDGKIPGRCVQLKAHVPVSLNGSPESLEEVNYGCVCVPHGSASMELASRERRATPR